MFEAVVARVLDEEKSASRGDGTAPADPRTGPSLHPAEDAIPFPFTWEQVSSVLEEDRRHREEEPAP